MQDTQQSPPRRPGTERYADSLTVRLSPAMRVELEEIADAQERTLGAVVRRALSRAVNEAKLANT